MKLDVEHNGFVVGFLGLFLSILISAGPGHLRYSPPSACRCGDGRAKACPFAAPHIGILTLGALFRFTQRLACMYQRGVDKVLAQKPCLQFIPAQNIAHHQVVRAIVTDG